MRRFLGSALASCCLAVTAAGFSACKNPLEPTDTTWTFVMGSSCAGRLNSAVSIYVDDGYKGQTTGELQVSVSPGLHRYEAFTDGRRFQWGPNQRDIPSGGLRFTLDC